MLQCRVIHAVGPRPGQVGRDLTVARREVGQLVGGEAVEPVPGRPVRPARWNSAQRGRLREAKAAAAADPRRARPRLAAAPAPAGTAPADAPGRPTPAGAGWCARRSARSRGEPDPGGLGELGLPDLELGQHPELRVGQLGDQGERRGFDGGVPAGGGPARPGASRATTVPATMSPSRLPRGMQGDQEPADEVGRGKEVGDAEEIACRGRAHADRVAGVAHHPDADHPLARRLPLAQSLEQDEVAGQRHEPSEQQDGHPQRAEGRCPTRPRRTPR